MNENDKNCQLKTNFQGCFSKKMHIFLMFEANENFLLEMQIFSLAPCCFFDAQFCLLAVQQGSSKVRDTKNVFCCILEMQATLRRVARLSKMCISSLENSAAPCFTFE